MSDNLWTNSNFVGELIIYMAESESDWKIANDLNYMDSKYNLYNFT